MRNQKPVLQIDLDSPIAIYRQIVDSLRTRLVEGDLNPGDVLPSVRRLALELGVTFNTVAQAYRLLAEEGWLDLKHGKRATVVNRLAPAAAGADQAATFRRRTRDLIAQMRAEGLPSRNIASELRLAAARLET